MTKAKVLCILNHKGGVGKTTTTINLGGALQQKGYKVLLIDLDGQANLTESMGLSAELPQTIYGAMKGEYPLPIYQHKDGMSVVPSCLDLLENIKSLDPLLYSKLTHQKNIRIK